MGLAWLLALPVASHAQAPDAVRMLDEYYQLRETDPARAEQALRRAVKVDPTYATAWIELGYLEVRQERKEAAVEAFRWAVSSGGESAPIQAQIGYLLIDLGQDREALVAFRRSLELDPSKDAVALQAAFLEDKLDQKGRAHRRFRAVARRTENPEYFRTACGAAHTLGYAATQVLPRPYFAELYGAPDWRPNLRTVIAPFEARAGVMLMDEPRVEAYGSLRATRDTRSRATPDGPQIYFDNALVLGAGVRAQPLRDVPWSVYAEVGRAYDLVDRNRDRWRTDFRVGTAYYRGWGLAAACPPRITFPFRPVADLYLDGNFYTRFENNAIGTVRFRPGLRIVETRFSHVDAYLYMFGSADTKRLAFNNLFEFGPGVSIAPWSDLNLRFRVEGVYRMFIDGSRSWDPRFRVEFLFRF